MNISQPLFLIIAVLALSSGHIGGQSPFQETALQLGAQTYCGRNLARAVAMVCYGVGGYETKRSNIYNSLLYPHYKAQDSLNWPLIPKYKAMAMGSHRGKRYVVDECCDKACTINELQTYC